MNIWLYSDNTDGIDIKYFSSKKKAVAECNRLLEMNSIEIISEMVGDYFYREYKYFWVKIEKRKLE